MQGVSIRIVLLRVDKHIAHGSAGSSQGKRDSPEPPGNTTLGASIANMFTFRGGLHRRNIDGINLGLPAMVFIIFFSLNITR